MNLPSEHSLDEQLSKGVHYFFERIPFNKLLGMEISYAGRDRFDVKLPMKPDFVGNINFGILHGGVISSVLDVAGGCMAVIGAFERSKDMPEEKRQSLLSKIGTIDLRIDYLRPGKGQWFVGSACLLRTGKKVAVTRMEFHNDESELLALGTGTYLCG